MCCGLSCRWARHASLPSTVIAMLPGIVAATIDMYNKMRASFLPTPAKCHYLYNMRAMTAVFQV